MENRTTPAEKPQTKKHKSPEALAAISQEAAILKAKKEQFAISYNDIANHCGIDRHTVIRALRGDHELQFDTISGIVGAINLYIHNPDERIVFQARIK